MSGDEELNADDILAESDDDEEIPRGRSQAMVGKESSSSNGPDDNGSQASGEQIKLTDAAGLQ